jgi:hypothetical protein
VYYERYLDDSSSGVQTRSVPLVGQQAIIESVDLGFMDPGTGKIENRTRFAFRITRAHGFQGGEYRVTIRDGRNGQVIGTPVTLKLEGENEVIDRRAMVFAGNDKKEEGTRRGPTRRAKTRRPPTRRRTRARRTTRTGRRSSTARRRSRRRRACARAMGAAAA